MPLRITFPSRDHWQAFAVTQHESVPSGYMRSHFADPAEDFIGPFFERREGERLQTFFQTRAQHANSMGSVNGGVLLAYADYCFSATGRMDGDDNEHCVTVSLDAQFVAAAKGDEVLYGEGEIVRRGRSMVFVRGRLFARRDSGEVTVLSFSGVGKRTWT